MDNPISPQPPEFETEPAGEANTTVSTTQLINDAVEPPQTEAVQPPTEPVPTPETPEPEPLSEPMAETPTAQMGRNEPLPESEPATETLIAEATAEAPEIETPTPSPTPTPNASVSEETPLKTEESPRTPLQQGTAQLEPPPTPAHESTSCHTTPQTKETHKSHGAVHKKITHNKR
jgi:hypothetical protein